MVSFHNQEHNQIWTMETCPSWFCYKCDCKCLSTTRRMWAFWFNEHCYTRAWRNTKWELKISKVVLKIDPGNRNMAGWLIISWILLYLTFLNLSRNIWPCMFLWSCYKTLAVVIFLQSNFPIKFVGFLVHYGSTV